MEAETTTAHDQNMLTGPRRGNPEKLTTCSKHTAKLA